RSGNGDTAGDSRPGAADGNLRPRESRGDARGRGAHVLVVPAPTVRLLVAGVLRRSSIPRPRIPEGARGRASVLASGVRISHALTGNLRAAPHAQINRKTQRGAGNVL